jgi:hypothetical protein
MRFKYSTGYLNSQAATLSGRSRLNSPSRHRRWRGGPAKLSEIVPFLAEFLLPIAKFREDWIAFLSVREIDAKNKIHP